MEVSDTLRKICCVVGGFFTTVIATQFTILGNLGQYAESYLVIRLSFVDNSAWFIPALNGAAQALRPFIMVLTGYLHRKIGGIWTCLIGAGILIVSYVVSHWIIQASAVALIVTFGLIPGIASSILIGCPFQAINKHGFKRQGLVYGIVSGGFGCGGFILNLVVTAYVNPHNLRPDKTQGNLRHFSQPEILDRVPYMYILMAGIYLLLLPIVLLGMGIKPVSNASDNERHDLLSSSLCTQEDEKKHETQDLSPRQLLFSRTFYLVFTVGLLTCFVNVAVLALYKSLGLTQIPDDVFMATLGSVGFLCSAFSAPVFGLIIDKIGLKMTQIVMMGIGCILTGFWYASLMGGRVPFFITTLFLLSNASYMSVFCSVATKAYFGNTHYISNLGMVFSSLTIGAMLLPLVTSSAVTYFGWSGFTFCLSVVHFISLLVSLLFPEIDF